MFLMEKAEAEEKIVVKGVEKADIWWMCRLYPRCGRKSEGSEGRLEY